MRRLLMGLLLCAGAVQAEIQVVPLRSAGLELQWHADSLAELGLEATPFASTLKPDGSLRVVLRDGQLIAMRGTLLELAAAPELRRQGRRFVLAARSLEIVDGDAFAFILRDREGRDWLTLDHAHPQQRSGGTAAEWRHFDVRLGAAFAARLGDPRLTGVAVASARMHAELTVAAKAVTSCEAPNFPTAGNYQIDVALTQIDAADATCSGGCTGNGAPTARVKVTPSAKLQGVGNGDAPWYAKFTTSPHNYPYPGNDQHPFLVWAAYRIDGNGRLEQLARSGVKHAFFSTNQYPSGANGCGCGPANVLWSGCTDTYGWSTNDSSAFLAPRAEIIPASGRWGRCGSLRDGNCDGVEEEPTLGNFDLRAVVRESDLVPALNPGAQWFIEAWYVVRDDVAIDNSFGHRRVVPEWTSATSKWLLRFNETPTGPWMPFGPGSVLERWLPLGTTTANSMSREVGDANGRLRLAVKVVALGDGRWRYDYALMNLDHSRPVTTGNEPNLRLLANPGPIQFSVPLATLTGASVDLHDGDLDSSNDWTAGLGGGRLRFSAPLGVSMPWGALFRFSLTTNLAPMTGQAEIQPGGDGSPPALQVDTLVPDTSAFIHADGFE
jgi:hypothetical protein